MRAPAIVLAIVTVLVAASGCGGQDPGTAPTNRGPVALTPDQYQANLDVAAARLQQAMRGVKTARTTRGLKSRMLGAERQLETTSTNLRGLRPPANAIGVNGDLATALDALAGQASSTTRYAAAHRL
jgi:hypothetical protein